MNASSIESLILGRSPAIRRIRELIADIAPSRLPVLIQGATGTGKELVAEALHKLSGRSGALVPVNVCAISESLFEPIMFGHTKGAFTGAIGELRGYVAEADGGTLFLDEISGLTREMQPKLLRALETRRFRSVGAAADVGSDFRLVSAVNERIDILVSEGRLRLDLAQRLSSVVIELPPLDERPEDIPLLAAHFARRAPDTPHGPAKLDDAALRHLERRRWPGNVRQLRQVVETAVVLARGPLVRATHFLRFAERPTEVAVITGRAMRERQRLFEALQSANGDVRQAAIQLERHYTTVYRRIHSFGLSHLLAPRTRRGKSELHELHEVAQSCTKSRGFVALDAAAPELNSVNIDVTMR